MEKFFKRLPKRAEYYVVIYDVFSRTDISPRWGSGADWRRARIARILLEVGVRTQKSVFEVNISPRNLTKLLETIRSLIEEELDKVYIYPIESKVRKSVKRLGYVSPILKNIFI